MIPSDTLLPSLIETVARARADLRIGLPVAIGGHLAAAVALPRWRRLGRPCWH